MLFNSLAFALFLPVVFALYWAVQHRSLRLQNALIVLASYVFYGWWDWRFLSLIALSSLLDLGVGVALGNTGQASKRRVLLGVSIIGNLGMLGVFKYFDFFATSFAALLARFGLHADPVTLGFILPVGISFYTFQTLSYTIDVYRRQLEPCRDPLAFFAYVSFFPQLVAGPIERATQLLPQFQQRRSFDAALATDGLRQMLWGFFKKVVIADNCAPVVAEIFGHSGQHHGGTLLLGAFLFAFQIYGDFSGYSDIAIGTGRLFGFRLMRNFAYPYFSRDIAEFWRRWHISLNTWFRDYLYIPLGGSRGTRAQQVRNILAIFLVSGLWHGANWTFVAWGAFNALLFLPVMFRGTNRRNLGDAAPGRLLPTLREALGILLTFGLTLIAWVFFRATDIGHAWRYLKGLCSTTLFQASPHTDPWLIGLIAVLLGAEWLQRTRPHALDVAHLAPLTRRALYLGTFLLIFFFGRFAKTDFIYFQF
ncbi:MAG: MBOAT family protein [Flavobacteriales bacterium]|nr:MBOAT family protein [Flavobacteriales bacterium]